MAVLALDLASQAGWAVYRKGMDRPFFGSERLKRPGGSNGAALEKLRVLLADQHNMHGITDIVAEAQHIGGKVDPQTVYLLIGLGAMAEWFAHRIGARFFICDIGTWRKHFLGKGNFPRAEAKQRCIDACAALGWHPPDDNAADACGILDYYLHQLSTTKAALPMPWRDKTLLAGYRS